MKRFVCLALLCVYALSFATARGGEEKIAEVDAVSSVTPNMPAGKIVIYTSMYENVLESLRWAMKRQFPGCQIEFVYDGTGRLQSRIAAEEAAGKLGCDILMVADPSYSIELKERGLLHRYLAAAADGLAFDYDTEGYWYPVRVSNMVLAYNPEKTSLDSAPHSFRAFAFEPRFAGTIAMSNPLASGTTMAAIAALQDKYGNAYFDALGKQHIQIETAAPALAKLESGEYGAVMVLEESILQKQQEELSKLQIIYPEDGTIMIPSAIMTIADKWSANNNTRTAEIITEWFLSASGQDAIVDGWMHSVRKNFRRFPYGSVPTNQIQANIMPVDWESCFRLRDEIQGRFQEVLTSR